MLSIAQFINSLAKYCPVDLLCLDSRESLSSFFKNTLSELMNEDLNIVQIQNRCCGIRSNRWVFHFGVRRHIQQLFSDGNSIVVYSRDYKQMAGLISASWHHVRPRFVLETHQIQSQSLCRSGKFRDAERLRDLEQRVFEGVDAIAPITQTLSMEIDRVFPNATDRRILLPVGVSERFFVKENHTNKEYDLIYSGNFSPWKGIDTLIQALAKVRQIRSNLRVLLVGAHDHQQAYFQKLLTQFDLDENVEFRGRTSHAEIPNLLRSAKIGIVPVSYQEDGLLYTSPLKLYEYLAAGLPIVAARVPSLMVALPEKLVYWAIPDDVESYAKTIIAALEADDRDFTEQVDFARRFTWSRRSERLVEFLKQSD